MKKDIRRNIELACLDYLHLMKCQDPWVLQGRRVYSGEYIFQCCGSRTNQDLYGEIFVNPNGEIRIVSGSDSGFKERFEKLLVSNID